MSRGIAPHVRNFVTAIDMNHLTDTQLLSAARGGDNAAENALAERYRAFVTTLARPYFLVGGDRDDLTQIGMIGLLLAIRTYDESKHTVFKTYAARCIRNALLDGVRTDSAGKNRPLNNSVSLEGMPDGGDEDFSAYTEARALPTDQGYAPDPEQQYIAKEAEQAFFDALSSVLNETDLSIIKLYLSSMPYKEISDKLGVTAKKVDNTIYNAKKKIEKLLKPR